MAKAVAVVSLHLQMLLILKKQKNKTKTAIQQTKPATIEYLIFLSSLNMSPKKARKRLWNGIAKLKGDFPRLYLLNLFQNNL